MARYRTQWLDLAKTDLLSIVDYISCDNIKAAEKIFNKIEKLVTDLEIFPECGRVVPELREFGACQFRELIYAPWRIIYKFDSDVITIRGVFDGRRDLEDILLERLL